MLSFKDQITWKIILHAFQLSLNLNIHDSVLIEVVESFILWVVMVAKVLSSILADVQFSCRFLPQFYFRPSKMTTIKSY